MVFHLIWNINHNKCFQIQHQQQRGYQPKPASSSASYNSNQQQNNRSGGYAQWRSERSGHQGDRGGYRGNQDRGNYGNQQSNRGGYQRYDSEQNQRYHSSRPDRVQGPPSNQYGGSYSRQ